MGSTQKLALAMLAPSEQISDDMIVADLFRLARSGRFRKAAPLARAANAMYPTETPARIKSCLFRLGEILS
jgi:hypothetical protein